MYHRIYISIRRSYMIVLSWQAVCCVDICSRLRRVHHTLISTRVFINCLLQQEVEVPSWFFSRFLSEQNDKSAIWKDWNYFRLKWSQMVAQASRRVSLERRRMSFLWKLQWHFQYILSKRKMRTRPVVIEVFTNTFMLFIKSPQPTLLWSWKRPQPVSNTCQVDRPWVCWQVF